ncbi:hypothetical protein IGI04_036931 [Brassica rapa subsp. trilocularis]|uniref:Uncharacterized protein n=1 Tax=Brassica rapa subsp. trilocularis TaxID=1813537 RepID=A0ABQ7LJQ3_BRACM|nr:hypothetical protein IGI04_036931 [Brassica rapa subsp. trilocularis]
MEKGMKSKKHELLGRSNKGVGNYNHYGICPNYPYFLSQPPVALIYHILCFSLSFYDILDRKNHWRLLCFWIVKGEGSISLTIEKITLNPLYISFIYMKSYSELISVFSLVMTE